MLRRAGPYLVVFLTFVWLNQSYSLIKWEKVRYGVFTDPWHHLSDAVRYPFIFLYRRSGDEVMYYSSASQILGRPYDPEVFASFTRGRVTGASSFEKPPPPTDGHWHTPWAEVHLEYPAPVLPFVLAPRLIADDFEVYARIFCALMGACIVASIAIALDIAKRAGVTARAIEGRWWLAAGLVLAQGSLTVQRLDPVVALTMILAVRGAVKRSPGALGFWAGMAGACKVMPLAIVPLAVACDWPFWRRRLAPLTLWAAGGVAIGFVPMLLASPAAFAEFFRYHGLRGLQVESTFGALVGLARIVLGTTRSATISYGSFNVDGAIPDLLAKACTPITAAGIVALTWLEGRRPGTQDEPGRIERVTCAALAVSIVVWLGGKVFSPQYMTWAIPLVLAIPGKRGLVATWLLIVACTLTQVYYRGFYDLVFDQRFLGVATVLVRQGVLVALLAWVGPWETRWALPRRPWRAPADADSLAA
jgi:hypothetical protein